MTKASDVHSIFYLARVYLCPYLYRLRPYYDRIWPTPASFPLSNQRACVITSGNTFRIRPSLSILYFHTYFIYFVHLSLPSIMLMLTDITDVLISLAHEFLKRLTMAPAADVERRMAARELVISHGELACRPARPAKFLPRVIGARRNPLHFNASTGV